MWNTGSSWLQQLAAAAGVAVRFVVSDVLQLGQDHNGGCSDSSSKPVCVMFTSRQDLIMANK